MAWTSYEGWIVGLEDRPNALKSCSWANMNDLQCRGYGKVEEDTADCKGHSGSSLLCHMISCSVGPSSRIC